MKCSDCGKEFDSLTYLTEYGNFKLNNKDQKGRCTCCFDKKFPDLHERKQDETSDK